MMTSLRTCGTRPSLFGDLMIVAFLVCQALDGIFTYLGVQQFGRSIEANPLIHGAMPLVGEAAALTAAKLFAASLGAVLHITGVHRVVALLTALYVGVALIPWTTVLFGW